MGSEWCPVCCTNHGPDVRCPGELQLSGAEKPGWRVNVATPCGVAAFGVLVGACDGVWRARIMTYPNVLWKAPGVQGSIKFVGDSADEAIEHAVAFIRHHCQERGFAMSRERPLGPHSGPNYPRKIRFLPVRFGVVQPSDLGGTGNLSETGVFIITREPILPGNPLTMSLQLQSDPIDLRGTVIWMSKDHLAGRSPGMGVSLALPPSSYLEYVRSLT